MPFSADPPPKVDLSFYDDTQLTDAEIVEREAVRQSWAALHERKERERRRRMSEFRWRGGML